MVWLGIASNLGPVPELIKEKVPLKVDIAPAINYTTAVIPAKAGHVVKLLRYPERHWIPDQVRYDRVGYLVARLIKRWGFMLLIF